MLSPSSSQLAGCHFFFISFFVSVNSDAASGKEMSDGYEGIQGGGKQEGKSRKHHRRSTRTRSRQEKTSKPKLTILNVSTQYMEQNNLQYS